MLTTLLLLSITPSYAGKTVCSSSSTHPAASSDMCICARSKAGSDWRDPDNYVAMNEFTTMTILVGETLFTRTSATLSSTDCWNGTDLYDTTWSSTVKASAFNSLKGRGADMLTRHYGLEGVWVHYTNPGSSEVFNMDAGSAEFDDTTHMDVVPGGGPDEFDIFDPSGTLVTTVIAPPGSTVTGAIVTNDTNGVEVIIFTIEDPFGGVDFWTTPTASLSPGVPFTQPPDDQ